MNRKYKTCWSGWKRAGLSLVEVVAAIVILGTILVGVVLAKARHTRQLALAQQQQTAVRAADELLSGWWVSREGVPTEGRGQLATQPGMVWETRLVENGEVQRLGARVVRLEVRLAEGLERAGAEDVLVKVDLAQPDPAVEAARLARREAERKAREPAERGNGTRGSARGVRP